MAQQFSWCMHRVLTPPPLPPRAAKAGRSHLNEYNTPLPPSGASDITKSYQIYVKQRSYTDVNSPYKLKVLNSNPVDPLYQSLIRGACSNCASPIDKNKILILKSSLPHCPICPFVHMRLSLRWKKIRS